MIEEKYKKALYETYKEYEKMELRFLQQLKDTKFLLESNTTHLRSDMMKTHKDIERIQEKKRSINELLNK